MIRLFLAIALIWLVLMPPFFTNGACSAEFDAAARRLQENKSSLATEDSAQVYWSSAQIPIHLVSAAQCRVSRPRFVDNCGPGDLMLIEIPVQNKVCHFYRDSDIRILLYYDGYKQLRQFQADMKPFKLLSLPWLGLKLYWGR
jgi:hypothetical protein